MGKRKIEMTKIEDKQRRFVTLSKRKEGLFKKAKKLSMDFGVEVAIIGFTVGGRPFSFGSSSVDDIIDKYPQNQSLQFTEKEKIHTVMHEERSNIKLINRDESMVNELMEYDSMVNELMEYDSAVTMLKDTPVHTLAGISQDTHEDHRSIEKDASFTHAGLREYTKSDYCNNAPPLDGNDINSLKTNIIGDKIPVDSSYHASLACGINLFSTDGLTCPHMINDPTFLPVLRDYELDDECWNDIASTSTSHYYTTDLQGSFTRETNQRGGFPFNNADQMEDLWREQYLIDLCSEKIAAGYETELCLVENSTNLHSENSGMVQTNFITKGVAPMEASFYYSTFLNNQQKYGEMLSTPISFSFTAGNFEYSDFLLDGLEPECSCSYFENPIVEHEGLL